MAKSLFQEFFGGRRFKSVEITSGGMFDNIGDSQADKAIIGISGGSVEMIGVEKGITALGRGTMIIDFLKSLAASWNGREKPGIGVGFNIDNGSQATIGGAIELLRALIQMDNIQGIPVSVGIPFNRAGKEMGILSFAEHMMAHSKTART